MREIKFRGKRIDNREWVYGNYHSLVSDSLNINLPTLNGYKKVETPQVNLHWILETTNPTNLGWSIENTFKAYEVIYETIGQFTGLTDRNGKEIFEGDVIETPLKNICLVLWGDRTHDFKNEYFQCYGWLCQNIKNNYIDFLDDTIIRGKIIGNIHDNPELLNKPL